LVRPLSVVCPRLFSTATVAFATGLSKAPEAVVAYTLSLPYLPSPIGAGAEAEAEAAGAAEAEGAFTMIEARATMRPMRPSSLADLTI
jgi:hypothetical protein